MQRPAGHDLSDATIRENVLAEFRRQSWAPRDIHIVVTDGAVDLDGIIFEDCERAAIRVAVENVPGVTLMRNHLNWVEPYSGITFTP